MGDFGQKRDPGRHLKANGRFGRSDWICVEEPESKDLKTLAFARWIEGMPGCRRQT